MRRFFICLLAVAVCLGYADNMQAQKKSSKKSNKSKKAVVEEKPAVTLPYNSNDCLFAIPLQLDVTYGPTSAPSGAGRLMEVNASKDNPYVVDVEHNTVWYKFVVPYNGELEIQLQQVDNADDYDMMVYKYTNVYFSNDLMRGKIRPIASTLSGVDSTLIVAKKDPKAKGKGAKSAAAKTAAAPAAKTDAKGKAAAGKKDAKPAAPEYTIGMSHTAKNYFLPKDSIMRDIKSIRVAKDEVYYILVDNLTPKGSGHSIKVSLFTDAFQPIVKFSDPTAKKPIDVELVILEKNTNNRTVVKDDHFSQGRISFVPGFDYTMYAKRAGYFSIYKDFNSNIFKDDTMMAITMNRAVKNSTFTIEDIYFTEDGKQLLGGSDSILTDYYMLFMNHPEVSFLIKGYVPTYGDVTLESDQEISLERALTVKNFFIEKGIAAERMTVAGMTPNEIRRAGAAANDPKVGLLKKRIELIVTDVSKK